MVAWLVEVILREHQAPFSSFRTFYIKDACFNPKVQGNSFLIRGSFIPST